MKNLIRIIILFFSANFLFCSCDYGRLGGADKTDTYYPGDGVFTERMDFFCGVWYSHDPYIGRLDGYRIRKWSNFDDVDKAKAKTLFPGFTIDNPKTYSTQDSPQAGDYVLLYDDTAYGQEEDGLGGNESWGSGYMGKVRAINIFNGDKNRGSIIIEYFEGADPAWLSDPDGDRHQGLTPGEKPFFGIYYRARSPDAVQMAHPVDLAAMYAGNLYYTEQETLIKAISTFDVENEAEFISWGVVIPQNKGMGNG
jgi:hypothetical protein